MRRAVIKNEVLNDWSTTVYWAMFYASLPTLRTFVPVVFSRSACLFQVSHPASRQPPNQLASQSQPSSWEMCEGKYLHLFFSLGITIHGF